MDAHPVSVAGCAWFVVLRRMAAAHGSGAWQRQGASPPAGLIRLRPTPDATGRPWPASANQPDGSRRSAAIVRPPARAMRLRGTWQRRMAAAGRKPSGGADSTINSPCLTRLENNMVITYINCKAISAISGNSSTPHPATTMHTDPIAFFLTWTCYGTWLTGDERGSTRWHRGYLPPRPSLAKWCRDRMAGEPVSLNGQQQRIVEQTIADHCQHRGWYLHELNCRTNHVHVVVAASDYQGEIVRDQLKAWCTTRLNAHRGQTKVARWWTRGGSVQLVFTDDELEAVIAYVRDGQDKGGSKANG